MRHALLLGTGSTLILLVAVLWPVPGRPVWLALHAGADAAPAFAAEGWRIRAVRQAGPVTLVQAMPEALDADPWRLRHAVGAALAMAARAGAGCSPLPKDA